MECTHNFFLARARAFTNHTLYLRRVIKSVKDYKWWGIRGERNSNNQKHFKCFIMLLKTISEQ